MEKSTVVPFKKIPLLQVAGLEKKFAGAPVLNGVNLMVDAGEIVVLMGPSGCGKSTLARCINFLIRPDAGRIYFDGRPVDELNHGELLAARRRIGFVFQHFNLVDRLTVLDNVMLGPALSGMERREAEELAYAALRRVKMAGHWRRRPAELSGGQKQRVGMARALAMHPDLMIWDEPTASLDPILVGEVLEVMEELALERHQAMLVITHELAFALRTADRLALMDAGRIVEEGKPGELLESPVSEIGKKYRNLFATSILPATDLLLPDKFVRISENGK
ncbi:MAG: amino acid ABC transporter ATP-binding protein [Firmicutes bacterium]|nr:amino acid ABC transporter ATP-binding protein [Bacillota bacterium]